MTQRVWSPFQSRTWKGKQFLPTVRVLRIPFVMVCCRRKKKVELHIKLFLTWVSKEEFSEYCILLYWEVECCTKPVRFRYILPFRILCTFPFFLPFSFSFVFHDCQDLFILRFLNPLNSVFCFMHFCLLYI